MSFVKGQTYSWEEIADDTNFVAGPVFYLLHRRGSETVTAAYLDIEVNPRAPYEIIPAAGPQIARWADRLCVQSEPIHIFVKELDGQRYYRGIFKVVGVTSNANELKLRGLQCNRVGHIYKIIHLAEVVP